MEHLTRRRLLLLTLLGISLVLALLALQRGARSGLPAAPLEAAIEPPAAPAISPGLDLSAYRSAYMQAATPLSAPLQNTLGPSQFTWPVVGPITQLFGVPELGVGLPHTGVDIAQPAGSPVRAAEAGRVVFAGGDPCCGLGYWIEVNHGNRYSTRYGHLMRPPTVLPGAYVTQGQVIGFSGNTGFSTGPHLHFEMRLDGVPIDPLGVLPGGAMAPWDLSR